MTSVHNDTRFTIENNILKGKVVACNDDFKSLGELILEGIEKNLDSVGQVDAITGEEYTFGKMRERSVRCALWMRSQGLLPRDVVALCSNNHLDFAMPCFATFYLGAIHNPWDAALGAEQFRHQMNVTKPKMVFASEDSVAAVAEAAKKANLDLKIIVFGRVPGFLDFQSIIAEPGADEVEKFSCTPVESSDEITLMPFTSGTTGLPKGVAISQRAVISQFRQTATTGITQLVNLNFAPVSWISGISGMIWTALFNIPRYIIELFDENSVLALIEKHKPSWVFLSPTMINRVLKSDGVGKYDLSSIVAVVTAGSPLSRASYKTLKELLPKAVIISSYGSTECCGQISVQLPTSPPGSGGLISQNSQVKVIDPDTGRTLGAKEKGELLLKTVSMMSFYYNNPEETAKAIDEEGWFHSGDFGYYDESGEIFAIDRLKDIIKSGDLHVSPSEIESVILSHSGVKQAAVVGQPQPDGDNFLIAFVVRTEDSSDSSNQVTETDIVNIVAGQLPDKRQQLRAGVRFVDNLPKTMSDKVRRATLRDLVASAVTN